MQKFTTVKKSSDFKIIAQQGKTLKTRSFIIKHCQTSLLNKGKYKLQTPLFGITVSRKVGKAVLRNLVKRRLKAILRHHVADQNLQDKTVALYSKSLIANLTFAELKKDVDKILKLV